MLRRIKRLGTAEGWRIAGRLAQHRGRQLAASARSSAPARLYGEALALARRARLRRDVARLWGPQPAPGSPGRATVVCLMRNGEPYVRSFVEHYTALGVEQIVLLDNGSADRTLELLRGYDHVTVLRSLLPYRKYQYLFKEYLIRAYGAGGWRLHVDIDELFDYPRSEALPLAGLLAYLDAGGYSAMVAYLLDMFAPGPLRARPGSPDGGLREAYPYYDLSNIRTRGYAEHYGAANAISNPAIKLYWGGIRNTLFGSHDWLTKHPLLRPAAGLLRGNTSHDVHGARVADLSGVLYHYKLTDRFAEQAALAVREGNYWRGSLQYRRYKAVLDQEPGLAVMGETARRLGSVDELVDQGFLAVSPAYEAWVAGGRHTSAEAL